MDTRDCIRMMWSYGGLRLLMEYCRMGLGWKILKQSLVCIVKRKPLKNVYYETNRWVAPILLQRYDSLIKSCIGKYSDLDCTHERSKIVWFCWLQGKDKMPDIVRACYNSQIRNIKDRDFRFIDENNWSDYVCIPDYLVRKYQMGYMPSSMFTDLIRLELLIKYGGSWIDSTVLCTSAFDENYLDADIFLYQYGKDQGYSNWFITSCTNNPMLMVIRDVLHAYWKDYNVVVDYCIFHLIFGSIKHSFPEMIAKMPYADSYQAISLVHNWHRPFRKKTWDNASNIIPFHKLTWRITDDVKNDKLNYYNHIIEEFS